MLARLVMLVPKCTRCCRKRFHPKGTPLEEAAPIRGGKPKKDAACRLRWTIRAALTVLCMMLPDAAVMVTFDVPAGVINAGRGQGDHDQRWWRRMGTGREPVICRANGELSPTAARRGGNPKNWHHHGRDGTYRARLTEVSRNLRVPTMMLLLEV